MIMAPNVWLVYFDVVEHLLEIVLTYRCVLPNGEDARIDEDATTTLDLAAHEDDQMVMDGLLAILGGARLSCAIRSQESHLWGMIKRPSLAVYCDVGKAQLVSAISGSLYNPDSSADFFFAGGLSSEHTPERVYAAAVEIQEDLESKGSVRAGRDVSVLDTLLQRYAYVGYTQTTEINIFTRYSDLELANIRQRLAAAAETHNYTIHQSGLFS
jgi:hypothetical protein